MHIDIDVEDYLPEFDIISGQTANFKSMTKSYGMHILFRCPDFIPESDRMQFKNGEIPGVELLCGGGSFAPFEISNANWGIAQLGLDDLNSQLKREKPQLKRPISTSTGGSMEFQKIAEMADIIADKYVVKGSYPEWRKIIWALHSMGEQYREIAHKLSNRKGANYDRDALDKLWDDTKEGVINIGTFYHYAKISNEQKFKEICAKYTPPLDISLDELADIFKCADKIAPTLKKILKLCNEVWWVIGDNQLWKPIKDPAYYIILEIRKYIDYSENKVGQKKMATEGEEAEKLHKERLDYLKYYEKINTPSYISLCKSYLKVPLCDNDFEDKLDVNPNMLAFKNGMVDLKTGELRPGGIQWDDYLTDTIRYDYVPANPQKTKELKGYLKQILNNDDSHLEYFLQILGFSFLGTPHLEKSLYFMIDGTEGGKGDNGKTFYFDILDSLMPHYVYKSKGTLLEDGNSKVHKQLCMTKGKRLVWTDEFSRTKKMNAVLMKELADGKTIENEILFGTSDKINVLFKMFVLSNFMIKIDAMEEAVFNRYKQASFCSNFDRTGTLKKAKPELLKFIADVHLGDKIKTEYRNEVFGLIVEYAKKYNGKIEIPPKFLGDAKEAKLKNDEFGLWFNDNLTYSDKERISMQKIIELSHFKNDFIKEGMSRLGFKYDRTLKSKEFGKDLNGNEIRGGFVGCSIIENEMTAHNNDFGGEHK
jgi:phage/plasmid-associated DNA primase